MKVTTVGGNGGDFLFLPFPEDVGWNSSGFCHARGVHDFCSQVSKALLWSGSSRAARPSGKQNAGASFHRNILAHTPPRTHHYPHHPSDRRRVSSAPSPKFQPSHPRTANMREIVSLFFLPHAKNNPGACVRVCPAFFRPLQQRMDLTISM